MAKTSKMVIGADGFGDSLRTTLIPYLEGKGIEVEDCGVGDYYSIAAMVGQKVAEQQEKTEEEGKGGVKGIVLCGTGMGVGIVANKIKGIRAAVCESPEAAINSRSINNSNVLAMGAMVTEGETAKGIVDKWLETEFKGPAPANKGQGWDGDIVGFLDNSMGAISKVEDEETSRNHYQTPCPICVLASGMDYDPVEGLPGATWLQVRKNPTRALVRFAAGSIEPAHHHSHGHDVFVTKGSKRVENVTLGQSFELKAGDYLYTGGGEVHRVVYHEETEFILSSDGLFDMFWDEPFPAADK